MKRAAIVFAVLVAFAAAPLAAAQEQVALPPETYVQAASGMAFPVTIGPFERLETVTRYRADGTDESVGYTWRTKGGAVQATVYVYPSLSLSSARAAQGGIDAARAELCATEFASVEAEIGSVHPTATIVENSAASLKQGGVRHAGRKLAFTITSPSRFGDDHAPLRSEAYLFCYVGGRWSVKYRFTYPVALNAEQRIAEFMRALTWTIAPETL